jgi:hypothetical protein
LEIFDSYRQLCRTSRKRECDAEKTWNSREGWLKLAHVCQMWRRVVFASSSQLHVRLVFTPRRPHRLSLDMMKRLPTLPIIINHRDIDGTSKKFDGADEALKHPDRVRAVTFLASRRGIENFLLAMSRDFCPLELLDLQSTDGSVWELPRNFRWGSAPSLRYLRVRNASLPSLTPIFLSATGLVHLCLESCSKWDPLRASLLLTQLEQMPCLCRLELATRFETLPPPLPRAQCLRSVYSEG